MTSRLFSWMFFFAVGLQCAAGTCDAGGEKAQKAFDAGKELYSQNDFIGATQKFREAYRLRPTWKLLYNIGQSEVAAKRYGMGLDAFEQYLIEGGDEIPTERQDEVRNELKRLRDMVGTLQVKAPSDSTIWVDGTQRGTMPLVGGILIPAGQHRIEARMHDEVIAQTSAKIRVGSTITVDLMPNPAVDKAAAVPPGEATTSDASTIAESTVTEGQPIDDTPTTEPNDTLDRGRKLKSAGIVTLAIGGLALIAGGVTGGLALSREKTLDAECKDSCVGNMKATETQRDNLALTTNILWGVGAAVITTGLILLVVGKKRSTSEQAARLHPIINPGYAGMHFQINY